MKHTVSDLAQNVDVLLQEQDLRHCLQEPFYDERRGHVPRLLFGGSLQGRRTSRFCGYFYVTQRTACAHRRRHRLAYVPGVRQQLGVCSKPQAAFVDVHCGYCDPHLSIERHVSKFASGGWSFASGCSLTWQPCLAAYSWRMAAGILLQVPLIVRKDWIRCKHFARLFRNTCSEGGSVQ